MKRTVLVFGVISGVIASVLMMATIPFMHKISSGEGMIVGYTGMIISFLMIFFGVRSYRENVGGGQISFFRGFSIGILITIISSLFYVLTWEIIYFNFMPNFIDEMAKHAVDNQIAAGASQEAINKTVTQMNEFKRMYNNPIINFLYTIIEPLPVGLIITLVSATVLRRKRSNPETTIAVTA